MSASWTVMDVHRADVPPPLLPQHSAPRRSRARARIILATTLLGLLAGLARTLLVTPETGCETEVSVCHLQQFHGAQLTKLAVAVGAGYLVGCVLTLPLRRKRPAARNRRRRRDDDDLPPTTGAAIGTMHARPRPPR
jgi:hypothetical protein